jgi:hypothetical protein
MCHYLPLSAHYLPLSATICHYLPLSATNCHYLPLTATICHYLPLSATICHYLPLSATICHYLPLSAFHLYRHYPRTLKGFKLALNCIKLHLIARRPLYNLQNMHYTRFWKSVYINDTRIEPYRPTHNLFFRVLSCRVCRGQILPAKSNVQVPPKVIHLYNIRLQKTYMPKKSYLGRES